MLTRGQAAGVFFVSTGNLRVAFLYAKIITWPIAVPLSRLYIMYEFVMPFDVKKLLQLVLRFMVSSVNNISSISLYEYVSGCLSLRIPFLGSLTICQYSWPNQEKTSATK